MSQPTAFAKQLVQAVNSAGTALTLSETQIIVTVQTIKTIITYEVRVARLESASDVKAFTSDSTKKTAVANSSRVTGTAPITEVSASSRIGPFVTAAEDINDADNGVAPVDTNDADNGVAPVWIAIFASASGILLCIIFTLYNICTRPHGKVTPQLDSEAVYSEAVLLMCV